jgi:hypothetical protein
MFHGRRPFSKFRLSLGNADCVSPAAAVLLAVAHKSFGRYVTLTETQFPGKELMIDDLRTWLYF